MAEHFGNISDSQTSTVQQYATMNMGEDSMLQSINFINRTELELRSLLVQECFFRMPSSIPCNGVQYFESELPSRLATEFASSESDLLSLTKAWFWRRSIRFPFHGVWYGDSESPSRLCNGVWVFVLAIWLGIGHYIPCLVFIKHELCILLLHCFPVRWLSIVSQAVLVSQWGCITVSILRTWIENTCWTYWHSITVSILRLRIENQCWTFWHSITACWTSDALWTELDWWFGQPEFLDTMASLFV